MNQHAYSRIGESDDHHGPVRSISDDCSHVVIRPYTCAFCNRGFSNAQALGGHMNIHRKDRAKLKLQALAAASASAEEQEDQEKMTVDRVLDDRKSTPDDEDFFFLESHQHKIGNTIPDHKRPSSAQDHATSTSGKDGEEEEEEEEEKMQLSLNCSLSVPELDLELRLGPAGLPAG